MKILLHINLWRKKKSLNVYLLGEVVDAFKILIGLSKSSSIEVELDCTVACVV